MKLALNIGDEFWLKESAGIAGVPAYQSLGGFISAILPNVYVIAGVILFILILVGGFTVITSAGKADDEGVKKGSQTLTAALVGFLIIFVSYWIIQLIEDLTGVKIFSGLTK